MKRRKWTVECTDPWEPQCPPFRHTCSIRCYAVSSGTDVWHNKRSQWRLVKQLKTWLLYECPEWCTKIGHDRFLFTSLIYYSQLFVLRRKERVDNNVLVTWWYCFYCCYHYWVQSGSSVIIVTKLWALPCRVRFLAGTKIFLSSQKLPDRPWDLPSLLYNSYRVCSPG
jgi:hypothetical protein